MKKIALSERLRWEDSWLKSQGEDPDEVDYIINESIEGPRKIFTVTRWEVGDNEPTSVHEVTLEGKSKWSCSCPAFTSGRRDALTDKHIQLVIEWIKAGKPSAIPISALDEYLANARLAEAGVDTTSIDWGDFQSEAVDLITYIKRRNIDGVIKQLDILNDMALRFINTDMLGDLPPRIGKPKSAVDLLVDAVIPSSMSGLVGRWMIMKAIEWLVKKKFMPRQSADQLLQRRPLDSMERIFGAVESIPAPVVPPVEANRIWKMITEYLEEQGITWEQLKDLMLEANMTDKDLVQTIFDSLISDDALREVVKRNLDDFMVLHPEVDLEVLTPLRAARSQRLAAAVVRANKLECSI